MGETLLTKGRSELHIGKVEEIIKKGEDVIIGLGSQGITLDISCFKDRTYLDKLKIGDEIVYITNGIGVKKIFFPVYEIKFRV